MLLHQRRSVLTWMGATFCTPVAVANPQLDIPTGPMILSMAGKVSGQRAGRVDFDAAMIDAMPQHNIKATTPWYKDSQMFSGPLLNDVLHAARATGEKLKLVALNDYAVEVPVSDAEQYHPVIARKINGKVLSVRDKGPLFLMYPFDDYPSIRNDIYYARCIWQLNRITVL